MSCCPWLFSLTPLSLLWRLLFPCEAQQEPISFLPAWQPFPYQSWYCSLSPSDPGFLKSGNCPLPLGLFFPFSSLIIRPSRQFPEPKSSKPVPSSYFLNPSIHPSSLPPSSPPFLPFFSLPSFKPLESYLPG